MTVGEAKSRIRELLDELGGSDAELEERMTGLMNLAQKRLAAIQKTVKAVSVDCSRTELELPADALGFYRLWVNGKLLRSPHWVGGKIRLPTWARCGEIEYFLMPSPIDEDTPDEQELEIPETAAACLPFLVAAELLSADLVQDGSRLLSTYYQMVAELDTSLRDGQGRVKNGIYGGRA